MIRSLLAVAAIVAAFACNGLANTITQTQTFSGVPGMSSTFTFNQFPAALGTLQSVRVTVALDSMGGSLKLDNDGVTAATGAIEFGSEATVSASVPVIDNSFMPIFQSGDITATGGANLSLAGDDGDSEVLGTGNFSYAGDDYAFYTGGTTNDSETGLVSSAVYGAYTGTGSFTLTVNTNQVAKYDAIGGAQAQIDPLTIGGSAQVIYTYAPVPEPLSLSALAMGALGLLRRRKA